MPAGDGEKLIASAWEVAIDMSRGVRSLSVLIAAFA
jgi:hypothetical protein